MAVIAKRTFVIDYRGRKGRRVVRGATVPQTAWELATATTKGARQVHVIVYNPSDNPAQFRATFTKLSGVAVSRDYAVGAWGRKTIIVDKIAGFTSAKFSTRVESLNGVALVAERSVY